MIQNASRNVLITIWITALTLQAYAQISPEDMKRYVLDNYEAVTAGQKAFYAAVHYQTAWIQRANKTDLEILYNSIKRAPLLGLQETDYQLADIERLRAGTPAFANAKDSLEAELRITGTAIRFYSHIAFGNSTPALGYNGLSYTPACYDIAGLLSQHLVNKTLATLYRSLDPPLPGISVLENKISVFSHLLDNPEFRETRITSGKVSALNIPLLARLHQLGLVSDTGKHIPDSLLKQKLKEAQALFNLPATGILGSLTLQELNIPLSTRLQQLKLSVNYYRWLYCLAQNQAVVVVNIPAADLKVYQNKAVILQMKMIVGKRSTPTPTLASKINEVILYPYWHVPRSIATKELLPAIKRNPGFINAGNYQVLDMAGRIVDPYSVNWHALTASSFPYLIRQSTGCDNALGLLKLNFYNPFGVYLHDTPGKKLFSQNRRYFSHGCMRMEKPMEMGHLVLKHNSIAIDTLEQKGCLRNQSPVIIKADVQMPVIVWYNPAGINAAGQLVFYEDIYQRSRWSQGK